MITDNVHYLNTAKAPTASRGPAVETESKLLTDILNAIVSRQLSMGHELIALRAVNAIALSNLCNATSDPMLAAHRIDTSMRAFAETLERTCEVEDAAKKALTDTVRGVAGMLMKLVEDDYAD